MMGTEKTSQFDESRETAMGILVIGSVFVDIKGYPLEKYIPGGRNAGRVIQTHGGVCRNVVEDIGNIGLAPAFLSVVDDSGLGTDVIHRLQRHQVNTDHVLRHPDGLGTWLAVFDHTGDVVASISKRPDLTPLLEVLEEQGDRLVREADSVVVEIDIDLPILEKILALSKKHRKEVYGVVSIMSLALERRELLQKMSCIVFNRQEAGMFFSDDFAGKTVEEMQAILVDKLTRANIPRMVITLGAEGAVHAELGKSSGYCPSHQLEPIDTTGAGDAFFTGVAIGLTYGKSLAEACRIGTRLATSVILTRESVCPRFRPEEFGLPRPE